MSATATERDLEMLAWLAERDMEAVAHAHAQFLAATEPAVVADLGRTYQRVSRCLRTTLALKMKAAQDRAVREAHTTLLTRREEAIRETKVEARTIALQDAVGRIANAALPDPLEREERLADFDMELDDWMEADDYATADFQAQVLRACRLLDLPEELASDWRALPRPTVFPEDLDEDDDVSPEEAPEPSPPRRDTS